jgi:large subunit ribosomal protein L4
MSKMKVYDSKGKSIGDVDVADKLLGVTAGAQALRDAVVATMAARRDGTASTKSKGEVAGSSKKPHPQKGTGRARAGFRQSPIWRGGAVAFGPRPRSYAKKVNRKVSDLALCRAFSDAVAEEKFHVIDELVLAEGKTKLLAELIGSLKIKTPILILDNEIAENVMRATGNLKKVDAMSVSDISSYDLIRYRSVLISKDGMTTLTEKLEKKCKAEAKA